MGGRGSSSGNISKLPKLEGSEKQVKWATDIRKNTLDRIKEINKMLKEDKGVQESLKKHGNTYQVYSEFKKDMDKLSKVTSAKTWITYNHYGSNSVISDFAMENIKNRQGFNKVNALKYIKQGM